MHFQKITRKKKLMKKAYFVGIWIRITIIVFFNCGVILA